MRLAVVITHPVQYYSPIFRGLAAIPGMELMVYFGSDHGARPAFDPNFKQTFAWDSNPVEGYPHAFISGAPLSALNGVSGIKLAFLAAREVRKFNPDAVMMIPYLPVFITATTVLLYLTGHRLLLRAETTDRALDRSPMKDLVRRLILRLYYKQFFRVFPIGTNSVEHYLRTGVSEKKQIKALYSVDSDYFAGQVAKWLPQREQLRKTFGIPSDAHVLLYSGKMSVPKNPLLIPAALAKLCEDVKSNLWLVALGDGEFRGEFERLATAQLGKRALFVGFKNQSELGKFFSISDTLILPSRSGETWGLVVNEALQFGLRVIVSDKVGSARDLVRDDSAGWIFPAGNSEALARSISLASGVARNSDPQSSRLPHPTHMVNAVIAALKDLKAK